MYGSIVDSNAPASLQQFYANEMPQFVFQAVSPFNYVNRRAAFSSLFGQLIFIGFFGATLYSLVDFTSLTTISGIMSQLSSDLEGDVLVGIVACVVFGSIIKLIFTIAQLFIQKKVWFIGTKKQLIISDTKKAESIDWDKFESNPQFNDNFDASSLILNLKKGTSIDGTLYPSYVSWSTYAHLPIQIKPLPNPEIKRLIETLIKNSITENNEDFKF